MKSLSPTGASKWIYNKKKVTLRSIRNRVTFVLLCVFEKLWYFCG